MLLGWSGHGHKACLTCNDDTPSKHVKGKVPYVGYRQFLPSNINLRKNKMFNGKVKRRHSPCKFNNEDILRQLSHVINDLLGKHKNLEALKESLS